MRRIRKLGAGSRMGGPITFPTPNFLTRTILRKVAFYAPLPHFENPCLLQLGLERAPALLQGRGRERAPLLSALPMERQLCAGNRDDLGNLQGARMWQPRDSRGAPAGASPPRHSQHCCRYGPRQHSLQ